MISLNIQFSVVICLLFLIRHFSEGYIHLFSLLKKTTIPKKKKIPKSKIGFNKDEANRIEIDMICMWKAKHKWVNKFKLK